MIIFWTFNLSSFCKTDIIFPHTVIIINSEATQAWVWSTFLSIVCVFLAWGHCRGLALSKISLISCAVYYFFCDLLIEISGVRFLSGDCIFDQICLTYFLFKRFYLWIHYFSVCIFWNCPSWLTFLNLGMGKKLNWSLFRCKKLFLNLLLSFKYFLAGFSVRLIFIQAGM